jgi:FlgD Ig-like domain
MKIMKILFLGIVLVLFNIAYLAAQSPDTVFVTSSPVAPGGVLEITYEVHLNSESVGGMVIVIQGVPAEITPIEGDWYTWGEGYGAVLEDESSWPKIVKLTEEAGLEVTVLGVDIDDLFDDGDLASKSGVLITYSLQVPEDMALGVYPLTSSDGDVVLPTYPIPGPNVDPNPVVIADPIEILDIPEYDALELPDSLELISTGGKMSLPIKMMNKDDIASGSFKVTYPGSTMMLTGITAGSRAGNMTFTITASDTAVALAAAGDITATVEFSGDTLEMGGLGDLCSLDFAVSGVSAGSSVSLALADVVLNDPAGTVLADLQQPTVATSAPEVFYGDSLMVGVISGAFVPDQTEQVTGISVIEDGMLKVPIMLTNSVDVVALDIFVTKTSANDSITLVLDDLVLSSRVSGWALDMSTVKDTVDFVHIVGVKTTAGSAIAAGSGEILTLAYEIMGHEGVISPDRSIDVGMELRGVSITDVDGNALVVQEIDGVATVDYRVPINGEGIAGGASLPKAFALSQNHPNPFNPSTTINYQVPEDAGMASFSLNVYDIRGRLVRVLENGIKGPGFYTSYWDGTDNRGQQVSSGVYFYRFNSQKYTATRKMVLLK